MIGDWAESPLWGMQFTPDQINSASFGVMTDAPGQMLVMSHPEMMPLPHGSRTWVACELDVLDWPWSDWLEDQRPVRAVERLLRGVGTASL